MSHNLMLAYSKKSGALMPFRGRYSSLNIIFTRLLVSVVILGYLSAFAANLYAQEGYPGIGGSINNETATPIPGVGNDYIHLLSETVTPSNGTVTLQIGLPTIPSRGFSIPFSLNYNTAGIYHLDSNIPGFLVWETTILPLAQAGWSYGVPQASFTTWNYSVPAGQSPITCAYSSNYTFTDSQGTSHNLGLGQVEITGTGGMSEAICPGGASSPYSPIAYVSPGGDGLVRASFVLPADTFNAPFTVTDLNGMSYQFPAFGWGTTGSPISVNFPSTITDRNGNQANIAFSLSPNGQGGTYSYTMTDTAGRHAAKINGTGQANTTDTVTAGGLTYQIVWTSAQANYTMPFNAIAPGIQYAGCATSLPTATGSRNVVHSIILPNGLSYTFYYGTDNPDASVHNPYGLLSEIIYPNGGWVKYTWKASDTYSEFASFSASNSSGAPFPNTCDYYYSTPVVATRSVSYDGSTVALTQTFSYRTTFPTQGKDWSTKTTKVTTTSAGLSFLKTYSYVPLGLGTQPYVESACIAACQLPLEQTISTYDWGNASAPLLTTTKTWIDQFTLGEVDSIMAGGSASKKIYVGGSLFPDEIDEYDFGQSIPSRKTVFTYDVFSGTPGILLKACKTVIEDGSGTPLAETDYYYDGSGTLCGTISAGGATSSVSGLPLGSHDETFFGPSATTPRGNLTKQVRVLRGGVSPTTTYAYDETGQLISETDPCGNASCADMPGQTNHVTSYYYTDSPSGGNSAGNSNAYVTKITYPHTGADHIERYQYNYATGELSQSADENMNVTHYYYNTQPANCSYTDSLDRLTEVDYPDGGTTTHCYNDAQPSPTITTSQLQNSSGTWKTTTTIMDGLGHVTQTQQAIDPNVVDYVDTVYDGVGNIHSVSNPYRAAGDPISSQYPTDGITTYTYDALGRKIQQLQPDGSSTQEWKYTGNTVTFTDENNSQWTRTSDGLGRLTNVVEPAGFQTFYSYDVLNNLQTATQTGASGDTPRIRSFTYDSLGRLLSASNPETGLVCYGVSSTAGCNNTADGYDGNGNLIAKTDARGITTTYSYDSLNRLLSKSYSSGALSSCFQYDSGATNGVGRLTNEWTQAGSCPGGVPSSGVFTLRSIPAYDPMGRVTSEQQCTPTSCTAGSGPQLWYGYDLAGDPTCLINSGGSSPANLALKANSSNCPTSASPGLQITTGFDAAAHMNGVTSNWMTYPTNLYTLPTGGYGPVGPLNWTLGPHLSVTQSYTNRLWTNSITATGQVP